MAMTTLAAHNNTLMKAARRPVEWLHSFPVRSDLRLWIGYNEKQATEAFELWAHQLAQASEEVASYFTSDEWHELAKYACPSLSALDISDPLSTIVNNLETCPNEELQKKAQTLSYVSTCALISTLHFWEDYKDLIQPYDQWWTPSFRVQRTPVFRRLLQREEGASWLKLPPFDEFKLILVLSLLLWAIGALWVVWINKL